MRRFIKRTLKLFGIVLLSLFGFTAFNGWQVYDYAHRPQPETSADAAMVLGAAAWGDHPSPVFKERINHGITLYREKKVKKLIFTGGAIKSGFATEAQVAKRYAIKHGVPAEDIIMDTESHSTYENLVNTRTLMIQHQIHTIMIVSDAPHLARAQAMADDLGISAQVVATPTSRYRDNQREYWQFMLQETLSLTYYRFSQMLDDLTRKTQTDHLRHIQPQNQKMSM